MRPDYEGSDVPLFAKFDVETTELEAHKLERPIKITARFTVTYLELINVMLIVIDYVRVSQVLFYTRLLFFSFIKKNPCAIYLIFFVFSPFYELRYLKEISLYRTRQCKLIEFLPFTGTTSFRFLPT